jgi:hypothetical protein
MLGVVNGWEKNVWKKIELRRKKKKKQKCVAQRGRWKG